MSIPNLYRLYLGLKFLQRISVTLYSNTMGVGGGASTSVGKPDLRVARPSSTRVPSHVHCALCVHSLRIVLNITFIIGRNIT